ncbi:MAG: ATP-grasp domain-containing protein [Myxococcales bacterium]|nr:ATP-grasp domain-containing protein [Myxococcales bacterium]MCB9629820.1 ATP-grasp domain-containing protein [Sandaracinaceae bacterium]
MQNDITLPVPAPRSTTETALIEAMRARVSPSTGDVGQKAVFAAAIGVPGARLTELGSLPLGAVGHRLVATRYLIANGKVWLAHFAWEAPLERLAADGPERLRALAARIDAARAAHTDASARAYEDIEWARLASLLELSDGPSDDALRFLVAVQDDPTLAATLRARLRADAPALHDQSHRTADLSYLATYDLARLPATTVGEGALRYLVVADKGEMGVRAVRVAITAGMTPVVFFSAQDDADALQVRLAVAAGGFGVPLEGGFRESYANPQQMTARLLAAYAERFGDHAADALARSALYPGYGPLAENGAAIQHFRRSGLAFVGPMQDVVELAGDKRQFRALAEAEDPSAVTPGIILSSSEPSEIVARIDEAHAAGRFTFPGRLKAANGGGGRGQVVIQEPAGVAAAVQKVLGEISANGWDPGVMFEQNIPETIHLEVQVARDRYGNTRHFGMRDCSEQRASQKVQEEAPPALLRNDPALEARICAIAVRIADACGYVGACTVELMYKSGHFYLLEMNTRIQVEHPVTEEAHRVRRDGELEPLDLVRLQLRIARGLPIPFQQEDVVCTAVARELRVNAESWRGDLKDSRDGERGLFLPNAGVFDVIDIPTPPAVLAALRAEGVEGIAELGVRFDVGFEVGDKLVNKDPTFGKLIVSVTAEPAQHELRYELLRRACLTVLRLTRIEGRQVKPDGQVIRDSVFETNLRDHARILEADMMKEHANGVAADRHVNWVIRMLRTEESKPTL